MKILKVLLRNLHSLRNQVEIDFAASPLADSGLFAITGDTGAGKTTILDALTLAIYGEICRGGKAYEALSYGASEGLAECVFEAKGRRFLAKWTIRRTKSKKENNTEIMREVAEWDADKGDFFIRAARKVSEVDNFIEQVTGLDFQRFTRSVLLAQGDFAAFLRAPHRERSELLERITGTEIYTQLSLNAYHRAALEDAFLKNLENRQKSLHVLTKVELDEIKSQLEQVETESRSLNLRRAETAKALQICLQIKQLESRLQEVVAEIEILEGEKNHTQTDLLQLELHRKTLPFQAQIHRLDDKNAEILAAVEEVGRLECELAALQTQAGKSGDALQIAKLNLKEVKELQPKSLELFDKTAALDAVIESKLASFEKGRKDLAERAAEFEKNKLRKVALETEFVALQKRHAALETWLQDNAILAELTKDLPAVLVFRTQLRETLHAKNAAEQQQNTAQNNLETARLKAALFHQELQTAKAELEKVTQLFNLKAPETYATSRQDLLEKLSKDIENLAAQEKNFRQLHAFDQAYRQVLAETTNVEEALDRLQINQEKLDFQMLQLTDEQEEMKKNFEYRQAILLQQETFEKYQDDRAALEEGQHCPLCFSTHHPFREHDFQPMVSQAKKEFEQARKDMERLGERKNWLLQRSFEITSELNHQAHLLTKLSQQRDEYERKFVDAFPVFPGEEAENFGSGWLLEKLVAFEQLLVSQKTLREDMLELHRKMERQEKTLGDLTRQVRETEFELLQAQQNLKYSEQYFNDLHQKFEALNLELNSLVNKYGCRFVLGQTNGIFDELSEKEKNWLSKKSQEFETQRNLELTGQSLRQIELTLAETEKKYVTQSAELASEEEKLNALKTERRQLFGDKNVAAERAAFWSEVEKTEQVFSAARTEAEKIKLEVSRCQLSLQTQQDRLESGKKLQTEILAGLNMNISKAGFDGLEQLRHAILPEEKAAQLAELELQLRRRELEARQAQQGFEKELTTLRLATTSSKSLEDLQAESQELEENFQAIQQTIGGLKLQVEEQDKLREEAESLTQQIENQRKIYFRWAALKDLIGSSDGSKFRRFAQGLTLQKLVQLANSHLGSLSGRYRIRKRPGDDLELDIVDTYQAENVRSMHSLSGGESFLVSLALALGLSDLAGRDANIRSLFIDEGFGSLDDQALDVAISTLENLQATGKTIGVISHVKEMKERIAVQIKVIKKGGGVSVVEVV